MSPRPKRAMKLICSGVIFSAATVRSPSFSRSSSSTTMIIRPWRISSTASSIEANWTWFWLMAAWGLILPQQGRGEVVEQRAQSGGAGDGQDPGPHDAVRDPPAHRRQAVAGAHADDGAGDGVGGADGDAGLSGAEQRQRARGFRREAAERVELGDALAHGLDDAPAAGHGAAGNGQVAQDDYPEGNLVALERAAGHEGCGDDAHSFLGVVGAVAEAESGGREELEPPEPLVHPLRGLATDKPAGEIGRAHV